LDALTMGTLAWISAASIVGGLLSALAAALLSFSAPKAWIPSLVSFAVGALLGAAFLEILPHTLERARDYHTVATTVLIGILIFFVLEKLVLWRHCHIEDCEVHTGHETGIRESAHVHGHGHGHGHEHDHGRSGMMILIGDGFHNFVDGVLIAAAFLESTSLGIVTAAAVIAHEIPQETGDFLILLNSGFTKTRAFVLNLLSSLAMLVGSLIAYFALQDVQEWIGTLLALAASSMIYVAVADLIPGLHRRPELRATGHQITLIALGVVSIWGVGLLTHSH
jgi:zinc and cadmium transporter